jgi:hypothetical protein
MALMRIVVSHDRRMRKLSTGMLMLAKLGIAAPVICIVHSNGMLADPPVYFTQKAIVRAVVFGLPVQSGSLTPAGFMFTVFVSKESRDGLLALPG